MKPILALSALLAAVPAFAGPYDQAYSIITTDTSPSADPHRIPVIVNRVDDRNASPGGRTGAVVPPGRHDVTVDVPPRQGFHVGTQHTFSLTTEPCTRYYIAAELHSTLGQEWKPVVRSQERIGECEAKFAR